MFHLDDWLRSQKRFSLDYLRLGRNTAKIYCLESDDYCKIKWASSTVDSYLLRQESIWLRRLFRNQKNNIKKHFNDDVFYIFDYHEGSDLSSLLVLNQRDDIKFDKNFIRNIIFLIFKEIVGLHGFGVVHGDLKPQNILFSNNEIRIIDFGSAGWIGGDVNSKRFFSYSKYYSLPNVLSYKKYDEEFDWYAFFLILSVFFDTEPISLKTMSPADFTRKCMFFLDELGLDGQDRLFLENVLFSIMNNQSV